ncbi:hypothetical protein NFI95_10500 [Acetobacteraceae bacterium KSS8]|uniref:Uncharacterized protein n=1 Tax=Endosaccharibacter trunci TaxID=2812733 RepID=A0ABT1W7N7_9PROT|nr:hypothetical protein [Acetobacteraceae bacterium KSS8]
MKKAAPTLAAALLCIAASPCLGKGADPLRDTGSRVATLGATTVQSLPLYPGNAASSRLVVWSEGAGQGQTTKLALCERSGECSWRKGWPDAYGPVLRAMGAWSTANSHIFLLTVQFGAAAETLFVLDVPDGDKPVVLDTHDAALIWLDPRDDLVHLDYAESGPPVLGCLGWSSAARKLVTVSCLNTDTR